MVWDYNKYRESLKSDTTDLNAALGALGSQDPTMAQNAQNLYKEILTQQKAGSEQYWSKGNTASSQAAAADFALRLAENGVGSLTEVGQRTVSADYARTDRGNPNLGKVPQYYNKTTGEALPRADLFGRGHKDLGIEYNLNFEHGVVIPYTSNRTSSWVSFRESTLKPIAAIALAAYGVPYVSTALGATSAGASLVAVGGQAALTGVSAGIVSGSVSLIGGNSFEDALKGALVSGLTAGATAGFADTIGQSMGFDAGSVASKAAGGAIIAGAKAGITDEDVLTSMATAAVSAYLSNKEPAFDATEREGSLAKLGVDGAMTTDFGSGADYSLTGGLKFGSTEGIKVDQNFDTGVDGPVDYSLTSGTTPTGLQTSTSPNLTARGGGQGITATRDDGTTLAGEPFKTGLSKTDIKTGVKIAGVLMADKAVTNITMGDNTTAAATQNKDKYRNAPLAGFRMVKFDDPVGGGSKYIPFVGEKSLLPPPAGYNKSYAKGGFVSKPVKRNGLASRK